MIQEIHKWPFFVVFFEGISRFLEQISLDDFGFLFKCVDFLHLNDSELLNGDLIPECLDT